LRELGIDPLALRGTGIHEMEGLFEQLLAAPRKQARVEAFYGADRELSDQATAGMMQRERGAFTGFWSAGSGKEVAERRNPDRSR
jgi:hypothetical protein